VTGDERTGVTCFLSASHLFPTAGVAGNGDALGSGHERRARRVGRAVRRPRPRQLPTARTLWATGASVHP